MTVDTANYDEVVAKISAKYENDLKRGDEIESCDRISTGSVELDAAMGGGVPQKRWTRFYGGFSSCKTLTALHTLRNAQALGLKCAYWNIEKQYDPEFARDSIGIDIEDLLIVEGTSIEEIGEKMEALFQVVHFHVVDSCSIAVSEDELNADVRDWRPGIGARAWGKVFRRLNERFDHSGEDGNTVILIDQVRTNFKTGSDQAAGGKVFDHQSSMSVSFRKGSGWLHRNEHGWLDEKAKQKKGIDDQQVPAGIEIKARVEKSRVCRPLRTATRRFDLDLLAFDDAFELKKAATHYGVVRQSGKYYYYTPNGSDKETKIASSENEFREFMLSDVSLQEEIWEAALRGAAHG